MSQDPENQTWVEKYIREQKVPRYLYKFGRWHCGHNADVLDKDCQNCRQDRSILTDQSVWFASPATLNDPFDGRLQYRYDLMSRDGQFERVRDVGNKGNPSCTEERLDTETEQIVRTSGSFSKDPVRREAAMREFWKLIDSEYGVLSFAGVLDSILLWSHYADSHRGYCIEVDARRLANELVGLYQTDKHIIHASSVMYKKEYPIIIPSNDQNEKFDRHMKLLTTKSSAWEYEREYRFIYDGRTNLARSISKSIIKRVILGCQMPPDHREEICKLISEKLTDTEIWEANRSLDRFSLVFQRISD